MGALEWPRNLKLETELVVTPGSRSSSGYKNPERNYMLPTITAFAASPDRGRGLARDMQVRWALDEVGQPHDVRLLSFGEMKQPAHLALHPFGQIPTYEDGDVALFESGAIV
jgi:hypothetical protein